MGEKGRSGSGLSPPPGSFSATETTIGPTCWEKLGSGEERQELIGLSSPPRGFSTAETSIGRSALGEASQWGRKTGSAPAFLPRCSASPKGLAR